MLASHPDDVKCKGGGWAGYGAPGFCNMCPESHSSMCCIESDGKPYLGPSQFDRCHKLVDPNVKWGLGFCSITPHRPDALAYGLLRTEDGGLKACNRTEAEEICAAALADEPNDKFFGIAAQAITPNAGECVYQLQKRCTELHAASQFLCVDPIKPWRCPVKADGSFQCAEDPSDCDTTDNSQAASCGLGVSPTEAFDFECEDSEHLGLNGVPRQFEKFASEMSGGRQLSVVGTSKVDIDDGSGTKALPFGYSTPGIKLLGSKDGTQAMCMLAGSLTSVDTSPSPFMQLPDYCKPTCDQLVLLHASASADSPAPFYMATQIKADGRWSVVDSGRAGNRNANGAHLNGMVLARTAPDPSLLQVDTDVWDAAGTIYQVAGVNVQPLGGGMADMVALNGMLVSKPLASAWSGSKAVGSVQRPTLWHSENAVVVSVQTEDAAFLKQYRTKPTGKFGVYLLDPPAVIQWATDGTVTLVIPDGMTVPKGAVVYLSLSGAKAMAVHGDSEDTPVETLAVHQSGHSVSQCFAKALNTPKADDDTCAAKASFNDCREGKGQDAELRMLKGSEGSFAGIWCSFHGRATLAAQRNYHGADGEEGVREPGLALVLPMEGKPCYPMRAMQFVAHREVEGSAVPQLINVTLEPQGTLRVWGDSAEQEEAEIDLSGIWWHPDILSMELTRGKATTAVFPLLPEKGMHSERKGLVKDGYLYNDRKNNECGCWVQKRLVCEKTTSGGYKCDQMKRLVRRFKMNLKQDWAVSMEHCNMDDTGFGADSCLEECTDRLLAL